MANRFDSLMGGLSKGDSLKKPSEPVAKSEPKNSKPKPKHKDPNYKQVGLYLPVDVHQKLKIGSAVTGVEMSDIAAEGIKLWLEKNTPNI